MARVGGVSLCRVGLVDQWALHSQVLAKQGSSEKPPGSLLMQSCNSQPSPGTVPINECSHEPRADGQVPAPPVILRALLLPGVVTFLRILEYWFLLKLQRYKNEVLL